MTDRKKRASQRLQDPFADLKVGDTVLLSPPYIDPVHWFMGVVLWIEDNRQEILVRQNGITGMHPHKQMHGIDYVRGFGTIKQCVAIQHDAERAVRAAARQAAEIEDLARDLRLRLQQLFETVAADALKRCGAAAPDREAARV